MVKPTRERECDVKYCSNLLVFPFLNPLIHQRMDRAQPWTIESWRRVIIEYLFVLNSINKASHITGKSYCQITEVKLRWTCSVFTRVTT